MALSATVVWEVRGVTGADTNGGGFNSAAAGTDYSQQAAPQVVIDGATITATVHTTTTQLNIVGYTVAAADVGNIVKIDGGTMTAGRYQITTADTVNNRWTVDRAAGTAGQTGTGAMGGCLATIQQALTPMVSDNIVWVQADGDYTITATLTGNTLAGSYFARVIGYTTTRGDGGQAKIVTNFGAGANGLNAGTGIHYQNLWLDNATAANGYTGIVLNGTFCSLHNIKVTDWNRNGIYNSANPGAVIAGCAVSGCGITATYANIYLSKMTLVRDSDISSGPNGGVNTQVDGVSLINCYIHGNTTFGVGGSGAAETYLDNCIIANNTGASTDGITTFYNIQARNCLFYGNGRDGINISAQVYCFIGTSIIGCIFAKNGRYGLNGNNSSSVNPDIDYNGYWGNTSGAINGLLAGLHDVAITGTDPTNDPFTDKASADWSLNNVTGAGALWRAVGLPLALPGLTLPTGQVDLGPYQQTTAAGGGGTQRAGLLW